MLDHFEAGDRVVIKGTSRRGTVESSSISMAGVYNYRVKLDDGGSQIVQDGDIEAAQADDTHCPLCGTKWHISGLNWDKWYDCLTCKKTRERIMEIYHSRKHGY